MNFDQFDDHLFKRFVATFPLQDRLQLRLLSHRWKATVEELCQSMTTLKLFGCAVDVAHYDGTLREAAPDDLSYWRCRNDYLIIRPRHFCTSLFTHLDDLFPEVQHLVVCFASIQPQAQYFRGPFEHYFTTLHNLLAKFKSRLVSLSLTGRMICSHKDVDEPMAPPASLMFVPLRILATVNQMTQLRRLDLLLANFFLGDDLTMAHFELSRYLQAVLPQLEHLALRDEGINLAARRPAFDDVISALGPACTHLRLDLQDYFPRLKQTLESHVHLTGAVTHLHFGGQSDRYIIINECLRKYTALDYLYIESVPSSSLFFDILSSQRTHFTTLRFNHWHCDMTTFGALPFNSKRIPLASVLNFTVEGLVLSENGEVANFCRSLAAWLPNVEVLDIVAPERGITAVLESNLEYFKALKRYRFSAWSYGIDDGGGWRRLPRELTPEPPAAALPERAEGERRAPGRLERRIVFDIDEIMGLIMADNDFHALDDMDDSDELEEALENELDIEMANWVEGAAELWLAGQNQHPVANAGGNNEAEEEAEEVVDSEEEYADWVNAVQMSSDEDG